MYDRKAKVFHETDRTVSTNGSFFVFQSMLGPKRVHYKCFFCFASAHKRNLMKMIATNVKGTVLKSIIAMASIIRELSFLGKADSIN